MFLKLFGSIRNQGVPVTLKEYLDLLNGLDRGLCDSYKVDDFYNFAKLCLISIAKIGDAYKLSTGISKKP